MKEIILRETGTLHVEGKRRNGNSKPVVCITTGHKFASCTDAAELEGVNIWSISNCCLGKSKYVKVNGEKRVYKFAKEEPENCVDALATNLQGKLALLDKYASIIAELEAEEKRAIEQAKERERQQKAEEKRQKRIDILLRKCECAEVKLEKAEQKRLDAYIAHEEAKLELRKFIENN